MAINGQLINTMTGSDSMSMMSGFDNFDNMSIDSTPDSEFNFKELDGEEGKESDGMLKDLDTENIGVDSKKLVT